MTSDPEPGDAPGSVVEPTAPLPGPSSSPSSRFQDRGLVGEGGGGQVRALYDVWLGRLIGRKELRPGATGDARARFLREARVTARLQHTGVVPVHDLSVTPDGRPCYTMQLVRGATLKDVIRQRPQLVDRLRLLSAFEDLCNTVAYAHSQGVLHRDIKTQNVMVGEFGEVFLLDWGIARPLGEPDPASPSGLGQDLDDGLTAVGDVLGTPAYMSPEQTRGEAMDARSDVWALGMVLYEIVAGTNPFRRQRSGEIIAQIREGLVPPLKSAAPGCPRPLLSIVARALTPDPSLRYASARELAEDVARYRSGELVRAHPYGALDLLFRALARHRGAVVGSFVVLAFAGAAVIATGFAALRQRALDAERAARDVAEQAARQNLAEVYAGRAQRALDLERPVEAHLFAAAALASAEHPLARGVLARVRRWPLPRLVEALPMPGGCRQPVFSPDGAWMACAGAAGAQVRGPGGVLLNLRGAEDARAAAWSIDGDRLAVGTVDGRIRVWSWPDRAELAQERIEGLLVRSMGFLADGRLLIAGGSDEGQQILSALRPGRQGLERLWSGPGSGAGLAVSPDGSAYTMTDASGGLVIRDARAGRVRLSVRAGEVETVAAAWSPDGARVAVTDAGGGVWLVHTLGAPAIRALVASGGVGLRLAWSPDGSALAVGATDGSTTLWDAASGQRVARLEGRWSWAPGAAFSRDGRELLVGGATPEIWRYALPLRWGPEGSRAPGDATDLDLSPSGRLAAIAADSGRIELWDLDTGERRELVERPAACKSVAFSGDGATLAASWSDGAVWLLDVATGRARAELTLDAPRPAVLSFAGPRWLAAFTWDGRALLRDLGGSGWRALEGVPKLTWGGGSVSADGARLANVTAPPRAAAIAFDASGAVIAREEGGEDRVWNSAISPDGGTLAVTFTSGLVRLVDLSTQARRDLSGHEGIVHNLIWSRDSGLLVTAGDDGTARVWDPARGIERARLVVGEAGAWDVALSADGRTLVTLRTDGEVGRWDLSDLDTEGRGLVQEADALYGLTLDGGRIRARTLLNAPGGGG